MKGLKIKTDFIEDFIRAENTFLYQIVYDPRSRKNVPLNSYPETCDSSVDQMEYAGKILDDSEALRLALGNRSDDPTIIVSI